MKKVPYVELKKNTVRQIKVDGNYKDKMKQRTFAYTQKQWKTDCITY